MTQNSSADSAELPKKASVSQEDLQRRIDGIPSAKKKKKSVKNFKPDEGIILPEPDDKIMDP